MLAASTFQLDTAVNVTSDDRPHHGVPTGSTEYSNNIVTNKVDGRISEIN